MLPVIVHPQHSGHGPIAKRQRVLDRGFDQTDQYRPHFRGSLGRMEVNCLPRHPKLVAKLAPRNRKPICLQSLLDQDHKLLLLPNSVAICFRARNSEMGPIYAPCRSLIWRSYCSQTALGRVLSVSSMPLAFRSNLALSLRRRQIELQAGLGNDRLPLNDLQHQRRIPPRGSAFSFFFHHNAH